jgi:hypothetical protein
VGNLMNTTEYHTEEERVEKPVKMNEGTVK